MSHEAERSHLVPLDTATVGDLSGGRCESRRTEVALLVGGGNLQTLTSYIPQRDKWRFGIPDQNLGPNER